MSEELLSSDCILDEIKKCSLAKQTVEVDEEQVKLVIFSLEDHLFAFRGKEVSEIMPADGVTWIPGATELIPGVINLRGDIEAVIDLGRVLGFSSIHKGQGMFIMTHIEGQRSGMLVDAIIDVLDVPVSAINPPLLNLDMQLSQLVVSQSEYTGKIVNILSVSQIIEQVAI
jgi:purine-binding chemotaxis protein CheW